MRRLTDIAWAVVAVCGYLGLQGLLDWQERLLADRAAFREWVEAVCLPIAPDERAIARIEGGKLRCDVIENVGYGRAAALASAATMEIPQ